MSYRTTRTAMEEGPYLETDDGCSSDESDDFVKSRVACVCPKCLRVHTIKMHWIGRGTPRKFCQTCRNANAIYDA